MRTFAALAIMLLFSACAAPNELTAIGGTMHVLGPGTTFTQAVAEGDLPAGWHIENDPPEGALEIRNVDGQLALGVRAGSGGYALMRRTRASLLATPYLNWAWHVEAPRTQVHPVRLIVGLAPTDHESSGWWPTFGSGDVADVTRVIAIAWSHSALGRGTLVGPIRRKDMPELVRYMSRGGPEQGGTWQSDAVDLSLIHRQVWPHDDATRMEIRFIGIAVQPAGPPLSLAVANIVLTR